MVGRGGCYAVLSMLWMTAGLDVSLCAATSGCLCSENNRLSMTGEQKAPLVPVPGLDLPPSMIPSRIARHDSDGMAMTLGRHAMHFKLSSVS
jgi:hypothetical protein